MATKLMYNPYGTKLCHCCKQRKPIKGGEGGKFKPFVCAECKGKPTK